MVKKLQIALAIVLSAFGVWADPTAADSMAPNFVTASLMVMGPGEGLISGSGHAVLRMECPKHGLDYCFSYEAEPVADHKLRFLLGDLKMGMFAVKTEEFIKSYVDEGRSITQYPLNLPPVVKQQLWKRLDEKVAEGINLKYDYVERSCALAMGGILREALQPIEMVPAPWPSKYDRTQREIFADALEWCPWTRLLLHAIVGTEFDRDVPKLQRIIIVDDFVEFLRGATVGGSPVLSGKGKEIAPQKLPVQPPLIRPPMVAVAAVVLAVAGCWPKLRFLHWPLLAVQLAVGLLVGFLLMFSKLPATNWNWLVIAYNPLPFAVMAIRGWALCRKRRHGGDCVDAARESASGTVERGILGKMSLAYAAVMLLWALVMALAPHQLTDPAYVIFAVALAVVYGKIGRLQSLFKCASSK